MAEFKSNLLATAKDLCKKEDIALDTALLPISDEVDGNVGIDEILVALSEVIDCVQSAVGLECQPHYHDSPLVAMVVELELNVTQVLPHDQDIHLCVRGCLKTFHLATLTSPAKPPRRRVTLAEARKSTNRSRPGLVPSSFQSPPPTLQTPLQQPTVPDHSMNPLTESLARLGLRSNYRKLRIFSGSPTAPRDEDPFDSWMEQAAGQLQEWTASGVEELEKRRRISEALRPPASGIVRDLEQDKPYPTAHDYLAALEMAFGSTDSGEEIAIYFHQLSQRVAERPSEFLLRLNTTIRKAVRKGGVDSSKVNYSILQKFIRSSHDEMLLVSLRLRDFLHAPPSFIELLSMVRRYEEEMAQKKRAGRPTSGRSLQMTTEPMPPPTHPNPHQTQTTSMDPTPLVNVQTLSGQSSPAENLRRPNLCYRCGEDGHIRKRCTNPPNLGLVNQRLIQCIHANQGNGNGRPRRSDQGPTPTAAPPAFPQRQ